MDNLESLQLIKTRKPINQKEKDLLLRCYKEGLKNDWASGKFAKEDGDFIVEEDRLNKNSICFVDSLKDLKNFFNFDNWCLGQGIIYKNLFFLQQINGGDEWATHLITNDQIKQFESISFEQIIRDKEFNKYMKKLLTIKTTENIKKYFREVLI